MEKPTIEDPLDAIESDIASGWCCEYKHRLLYRDLYSIIELTRRAQFAARHNRALELMKRLEAIKEESKSCKK